MAQPMVDNPSESGSRWAPRKLTLSCSRCRWAKLKCDRKEPCLECIKRDLGHLCVKDERRPRAKRTKRNQHATALEKTNKTSPVADDQETEVEEAVQVLEYFVNGAMHNASSPTTATSSVVADSPNMYWEAVCHPQRQTEKLALLQEVVDTLPEPELIHCLYEVFLTRCQGSLENVVHTPTFRTEAELLCGCLSYVSPEARVRALAASFSLDSLACYLLALVLGLAFFPTPSILGWSWTPLSMRVQELRASDVHSKTWRALALRCLHGGVTMFSGSIAALQAAIMLLLDSQEDSLTLDAILVTAISGAQKLGSHTLGDAKLQVCTSPAPDPGSSTKGPDCIRTELGVRIWWALTLRDWSRAQRLGYYTIQPCQFTTRKPLNINDEDLSPSTEHTDSDGYIISRPRHEFTQLSYTIHALDIAILIRTHLNAKYGSFIANLPAHFRLGSIIGLAAQGPQAAIPVLRWMLHQQLWSLMLRLYRASLLSPDGRASCQLLAQNLISTQAQIHDRCTVCGSLSSSDGQLFNAAAVLLIDLLLARTKSPQQDACPSTAAQLSRLMMRDKVREAIELLRARSERSTADSPGILSHERQRASATRGVLALEALMSLEEEDEYPADMQGSSGGEQASGCGTLKSKLSKILGEVQQSMRTPSTGTGTPSLSSLEAIDRSVSSGADVPSAHDLDVLPIVSNDPGCDIWEYLDFDSGLLPKDGVDGVFWDA
ncbi:putative C6 transcription factor [Aspergillus homomorphus CBS 101889]|uniref:Zn(2)-C6 fungal-type domain-containing protein n=1 Tax=Aspergillus homomorphus (strain CBS 101889) TaxID=1450537 RepID=A0A395HSW8_ASPHC|nr:hypothetical protein BO97DRAFT_444162 [Aspergillus homomorphus CBS 101889]RAL10927.1 hypothetical protein BO97DRAFT_444162 [Aspergillus homomorphus CBS 101889]